MVLFLIGIFIGFLVGAAVTGAVIVLWAIAKAASIAEEAEHDEHEEAFV